MMKYRLTEKIGSGGMAEVFRAVGEGPEGFERPFVIKRIHPRLSEAPEFMRMFVDEAKISARLVHPNIVQVFDFAPQEGGVRGARITQRSVASGGFEAYGGRGRHIAAGSGRGIQPAKRAGSARARIYSAR